MANALWFDMDGTIYNLYKIPDWLDCLRNGDMTVFNRTGYARKSIPKIREIVNALKAQGWVVGVITWAPMNVSEGSYEFRRCYSEKVEWLRSYFPELIENFHCVTYGTPKNSVVRAYDFNVLVDDNKAVRAEWRDNHQNYVTINASRGYIKELEGLLG